MRYLTEEQLVDAVRRKIISPAQYDALLQMEPSELPPHMAHAGSILDVAATAEMAGSRESPRGFTWITIAYYLGALTVMFAFGWFLIDRWRALGAVGILVVTSIYTALFVVTGEYLRREGYRVAGALVTGLAVGMVPLVVWSIQKSLGLWPDGSRRPSDPFDMLVPGSGVARLTLNMVVIDIATIIASVVAFRRLRFGFLLAPGAIAAAFLPRLLVETALDETLGRNAEAWLFAATGVGLLTLAFAIDRRDRRRADFAYWPYLVGVIVSLVSIAQLWERYASIRHVVPIVGLLLIVASLTLRRLIFLAFGGVLIYAYLAWLAFDLFRSSTLFPIILATLGLSIILAAVWVQRTYPRVVSRVNAGLSDPRPWLPAGYLTPSMVIAFSMVMTAASIPGDRAERHRMNEEMRRSREEVRRDPTADDPRSRPRPPAGAADSSGRTPPIR
jgi:hypothetical protein